MSVFAVKFYSISKNRENDPGFLELLAKLGEMPLGERLYDFGDTVSVRMERYRPRGELTFGEFVRCQKSDLPYFIPGADDPAEQLDLGSGQLGHGTAFCFHAPTSSLAIQTSGGVSVTRIIGYLRKKLDARGFISKPKLREDAWERFLSGVPKKFEIKVAPFDHLGSIELEDMTMREMTKALSRAYGGATFTISVEMNRNEPESAIKPGPLRSLVEMARQHLAPNGAVRKLKVATLDGDDQEEINFLVDQMKEVFDLELPEGDVEAHYLKREETLRIAVNRVLGKVEE